MVEKVSNSVLRGFSTATDGFSSNDLEDEEQSDWANDPLEFIDDIALSKDGFN